MNKALLSLACFAFLIGLSGSVGAATPISGCTVINSSGTYVLNQSILNSGATKCIEITSSDVVFDGQDFTIDGVYAFSTYGVYVYTGVVLTNVTVKNLKAIDWDYGIYYRNAQNGLLTNNTANSNVQYGIYLDSSSSNTVANNNASSNGYGIYLTSSSSSNLANNTVNSNTDFGIYLSSSSSNTVANNNASSNGYGIYLDSSSNNIIANNTVKENNRNDVLLTASSNAHCNNLIENNTGSGDRPIKYFNYSVSLQNEILSELILCNADNSNIDNVTIEGSATKKNNGLVVTRTDYSSFTNINSSNNYIGISIRSSSNNNLANTTANSNSYGIYIFSLSYYNNITNNTANSNSQYGIYLNSHYNNLTNNIANSNSQYGIYLNFGNYNTLNKNRVSSNSYGIRLYSSSNNNLINNNISNNNRGIYLRQSSNYNILANNNASSNNQIGIQLEGSNNYNTIANNIADSNGNYGISLGSSSSNTLANNTANSNSYDGIQLVSSSNYNNLTDNVVILNNRYGILLSSSSGNNSIYNNHFNNTDNFFFWSTIQSNDWNTTKTLETNIIGGSYRGGNFWAKPDGTGFGETCLDANGDGICDLNYTLASGNVDHLPLKISAGNGPVDFCTNISFPGVYVLNQSIINSGASTCINISVSNVVFDGQGYTIDGIDTSGTNGVYVYNPATGLTNVTVKNLKVTDWHNGIYYKNASEGSIENNTASSDVTGIYLYYPSNNNTLTRNNASNNTYGLYLLGSSNNNIANNTANSNTDYGILLSSSSSRNNTLTNNNASNNKYGIYLLSSRNNTLTNNNASSNSGSGIYLQSYSNYNTITNNTANLNLDNGIYLYLSSNYNTIANNNANSNTYRGILLSSSSNNTISNNTANSNTYYGIYLISSSNNNTLNSNTASNNNVGIRLTSSSSNTIYNNFFNNTNNYYLYNSTNNDWNTAKTAGTNIIGGPYLGGNFWAYPNGTGFSETCTDANSDGICDSNYTLAYSNVDYLPLTIAADYYLTNPEAYGPYIVGDYVNTTWEIVGISNPPNFINVEYYNETDSTSLELVSYPFSPAKESDNTHQVGAGEAGHTIRVYIYFADDASDLHGEPGTRNEISDTYAVNIVPEFPFGFGIMIPILAGLYIKMRRWKYFYP